MTSGSPIDVDMEDAVRSILSEIDLRYATKQAIADRIGICGEMVRRKLKRIGTSIDKLKHEERLRRMALSDEPPKRIYRTLGFSSVNSFYVWQYKHRKNGA